MKRIMRKIGIKQAMTAVFAGLLCISLGANAWQSVRNRELKNRLTMQRQREMADVVAAMADIEVNLQKLLIASGAAQSVSLLGETALLAQHVESGLSRLPLSAEAASGAMKFAGQMGEYVLTLATQVSGGSMLTTDDERQIEDMLTACQGLNAHLMSVGERLYTDPLPDVDMYGGDFSPWIQDGESGNSAIPYPSLIYDGPFSDGRSDAQPLGLTGERITREQAREAAARFAGTTTDQVKDGADSGGRFEAFGFEATTPYGRTNVQVTGQGGHLLWMMPEQAEFAQRITQEECLRNAQVWLADMGFGQMESCFVQQYDGMVVANFASVQDGVLLYPDQVKVQVSMDSGTVVGAECSQYLTNHTRRTDLEPELTQQQAQQMLSDRLEVRSGRLCIIPQESGERLCWGFEGTFAGEDYWAFVDAETGEAVQILRVANTQDGQTAI
ncbi:MAG: germination protein YpeB [Clostridia bacterium]|nr:germination protein YpeB [Clostridia bacterium]